MIQYRRLYHGYLPLVGVLVLETIFSKSVSIVNLGIVLRCAIVCQVCILYNMGRLGATTLIILRGTLAPKVRRFALG